jgi:peptide/nickel transport system substrate-binding protein
MTRRGIVAATALVVAAALVAAGCSSSGSTGNQNGGAPSGQGAPGSTVPGAKDAKGGVNPLLGPPDDTSAPTRGGSVVFGLEHEPDGVDPSRSAFDASGHMIASAVFDPIAAIDDEGKVVPYLADKLTPSNDFKTWTITLRSGVQFHDGTPLTSEALKVNFDYWTKSFVTNSSFSSLDSYKVTGPLTLELAMKQPWTAFPYTLSTQTGYVAAPSFLTNPDPTGPSMKPVGTGPFKYKDAVRGKNFVAERNPNYWQAGLPYLDQVRFEYFPDGLSRVEALTKGDIDVLHAYQPTVITKVRDAAARGELKVVENNDGEEDVAAINTEKAPFDDLDARLALAYATDATKWREIAEAGTQHEVRGPFAPGQLGYSADDAFPAFDLAKAKEHADAYKKKTGKDIETEFLTTNNVDDRTQVQLLLEQWAKAGIKGTIKSVELAELITLTVLGQYQLVTWRNFGSLDPDGDHLWWHSSGVLPSPQISTNVARFKDPDIDKALDEARGTTDVAKRDKAYQVVAKKLNEGVAYIWLGRPTWVIAAVPQVQGIGGARNGTGSTLGAKTWITKLWVKR